MSNLPRIYDAAALQVGQQWPLDDGNFAHLVRVLRLKDGDALNVFNGQGQEYAAVLTEVQKKSANIALRELVRDEPLPALNLHLGQVISKGERMDFTIQKATELGISTITPLVSERCDVRLKGERMDSKLEHWQKVAISACQQSGRVHVPNILPVQSLETWLAQRYEQIKLVLHPHQQQPLSAYTCPESLALLVGPEGGFSETEIQQALNAEFDGLRLGPRILRTETAALVALSVLQFQFGDLS